jgi:hypothetical protein
MDLHVAAGVVSTVIFATSMMPMLVKAARTKNLESYSLGHIVLTNAGNAVHSLYVFSLPVGPIWALHGFYLVTAGTMLVWCLRYGTAGPAIEPVGAARRSVAEGLLDDDMHHVPRGVLVEVVDHDHHPAIHALQGPRLDHETWCPSAVAQRRAAAGLHMCEA